MTTTTTKQLADQLGKPHREVLRIAESLKNSQSVFFATHFSETTYKSAKTHKDTACFAITSDAALIIIMGMPCNNAFKIKLDILAQLHSAGAALVTSAKEVL